MNNQENYSHLEIILKDKDEIIEIKQALIESQNQVIKRLELLLELLSNKIATQGDLDYKLLKDQLLSTEIKKGNKENGQI
tara:strand:+ start:269 stop:508 length:240 start_codon:yes stop_codon:yes gene_type:complete